jgi:hypothetical protein
LCRGEGVFAYIHASIVEAFVDLDEGLEQVFTIPEPLLCQASLRNVEPLELQLEWSGDLCLEIQPGKTDAILRDLNGAAVFSYSGLKAWDAAGNVLHAQLEGHGAKRSIVVDDSNASYPIVIDPIIGCLRARLAPSGLLPLSNFGGAMACDGDTVVVCASNWGTGGPRGAAFVYRHGAAGWAQEAVLVSSHPSDDGFGASVAVSGNSIAVGAPSASDAGPSSGSAFIFSRSGAQWTQQARVLPNDGAAFDSFGNSVALQNDRLVVAAVADDDSGLDSGSDYVFQRPGAEWNQSAKFLAGNGQSGDQFGRSVDIDAGVLVIGAPGYASSAGSAYVYRDVGGAWLQESLLSSPGAPFGFFGEAVATSGGRIVVGETGGSAHVEGRAHVFHYAAGNWAYEALLQPLDSVIGNFFGLAVDLVGDRALIGSPAVFSWASAYAFSRSGGTWNQISKLVPLTTSSISGFGTSVAMNASFVGVGDPYDSELGYQIGAAYIFDLVEAHSIYCTPKINSLGCAPSIAAVGAASANATQGLVVSCSQVRDNTAGLLFYSTAGRSSTPFQGGTLCMSAPIRRTPAQNSGGNPAPANDCSGSLSIDMNSFARGLLGGQPIPELSVIGTVVQCQWWGRDQGFAPPFNSMLSDAVEFTVCQ